LYRRRARNEVLVSLFLHVELLDGDGRALARAALRHFDDPPPPATASFRSFALSVRPAFDLAAPTVWGAPDLQVNAPSMARGGRCKSP